MSAQHEFHMERAAEARGRASTLDNVGDRWLRAEATWADMAARSKRGEAMREKLLDTKTAGTRCDESRRFALIDLVGPRLIPLGRPDRDMQRYRADVDREEQARFGTRRQEIAQPVACTPVSNGRMRDMAGALPRWAGEDAACGTPLHGVWTIRAMPGGLE